MNTAAHTKTTDWLDLGQADREGPFSKCTLWNLIASGKLAAYRPLKRKVLVKRSDLDKLIEASRVGTDIDVLVDAVVAEVTSGHSK